MPQLQNKLPKLDARLAAAASLVREGACAADIGCDHGLLSMHLAASGKCKSVIACDMREKPLAQAKRNFAVHGLLGRAQFRLGDGLSAVSPDEATDIIIAGMSGVTIIGIISAAPLFHTCGRRFILVPASKPQLLRRYLYENGFELVAETVAQVSGFCYPVMCAEYTGVKSTPTELFCHMGLCNSGSAAARRYFSKVIHQLEKQGDAALAGEIKKCLM